MKTCKIYISAVYDELSMFIKTFLETFGEESMKIKTIAIEIFTIFNELNSNFIKTIFTSKTILEFDLLISS